MLIQLLVLATLAAGGPEATLSFEDPIQLRAGEEAMGAKRLYPSPVLHDLDGDKVPEMVIGDLVGALTVSYRVEDGWGKPMALKDAKGNPLRFHNW